MIVDWNMACGKRLTELGYDTPTLLDEDMPCLLGHAEKIFSSGLNVMLLHRDTGIVIAVDTRAFTQR